MSRSKPSPESALVDKVKKRLEHFEQDVDKEPWKEQHEQAMRCFALQETLRCGVSLYETLVALDEALRSIMIRDATRTAAETTATLEKIDSLFAWWLKPCAQVERKLREFEEQGFQVDNAEEFRRCYAEAKWMKDDRALSHEKMVEARDAAIDDLRSGNACT